MEYGPRALGNRSILADPGHPEMRDRINAMVKKREAFRPFAPACAVEEAHRWFNVSSRRTHMPYMITIVDVRPEVRASLPAITHVNGSARLQTVSAAAIIPIFNSAWSRRRNHGPTDGPKYQLQCQRPAHREYTGGSDRNLPRHRHRVSVFGELPCYPLSHPLRYPLSSPRGIRPKRTIPREHTIARLFAQQAARTPDAIAVVAAGAAVNLSRTR